MVRGCLALLYFLLGFHGGRHASGPNRGQSPVEWGDFSSVCPFVCPFVRPPLGAIQPGLRRSQPGLGPSQPGLRPSVPENGQNMPQIIRYSFDFLLRVTPIFPIVKSSCSNKHYLDFSKHTSSSIGSHWGP